MNPLRDAREARSPSPPGNFRGRRAYSSQHFPREQSEGFFDAFAGLGAGTQDAPALVRDLRLKGRIHFPILQEITLIKHKDKWDDAGFVPHSLFEVKCLVDSGLARSVSNQQVPGSATQVRPAHFLIIVFAINVPKDQGKVGAVHLHIFFVDLYADGGLVDVRIDALDEAPHETGLPYREGAEHA